MNTHGARPVSWALIFVLLPMGERALAAGRTYDPLAVSDERRPDPPFILEKNDRWRKK